MTTITDDELGEVYTRGRRKLPPGEYVAPCATVTWDGTTLSLTRTGAMPDEAVLARWPRFARLFAAGPVIVPEPVIEALTAGYEAATAGLAGVLPEVAFAARLVKCRGCNCWSEAGRGGRGYCNSIQAACACIRLWSAGQECPKGLWPA